MREQYSPGSMAPNGMLGEVTWADVWTNITGSAKEKATEVGTSLIKGVKTPGATTPAPTAGAPTVTTVVVDRGPENALIQFARENPLLLAGGAAALLFLIARRR